MGKQISLLVRLWWQPGKAMSEILDRGSLLFATIAVLAASLVLQWNVRPGIRFSFYTPLLILAAIYVPGVILIITLLARLGSFGAVLRRDYSSLLTCTAMAWTAVQIPIMAAAWLFFPPVLVATVALAYLYFGVLVFFAIRTVFGAENGVAAGAILLSWIPLAGGVFLLGPLRMILGYVASPFFLLYALYFLRTDVSNIGAGFRSRQNFRRMLETAAVNPHDAEAQYQLGLIYQQRRQNTEAVRRFQNAVAIDPKETDAHFQLGRIAREQGRLKEALEQFQAVIDLDEKHSQSEILRELGAVYVTARQYQDARNELSVYVDRRPYDPEGLFYYGQALEGTGEAALAREMYARAIEADRTAPSYRRRYTARWSRLAQKQVGKLRG